MDTAKYIQEMDRRSRINEEYLLRQKTSGVAYLLLIVSLFLFCALGLHRFYVRHYAIGLFYFPLSILTLGILPLVDLISLSGLVEKTNRNIKAEIKDEFRIAKQTADDDQEHDYIASTHQSYGRPSPLSVLVAVVLVVVLFAWVTSKVSDTSSPKKPASVSLAKTTKNLSHMCKLLVSKTISKFRARNIRWGKKGTWTKKGYNFASHRVRFTDASGGNNYFRITCCLDRKKNRLGVWSITDLNTNKTTGGSCQFSGDDSNVY